MDRFRGANGGGELTGVEFDVLKEAQSLVILSSKKCKKTEARSEADEKVGRVAEAVRESKELRTDHSFFGWSPCLLIRDR